MTAKSVLMLHCDYSRLCKALELLLKKCGSNSAKRVFNQVIKLLVEHDHLTDYTVRIDGDMALFESRDRLV